MLTFKEYLLEQKSKGTYAATLPSNDDKKILELFTARHKLTSDEPLHCTLLYSRKHLPNYKPDPDIKHEAKVERFEVWPKKNSDDKYLVLILSSDSLQDRYKSLSNDHGATSDYDEYKPHITLACEARDFDVNDYDITELPKTIALTNEYKEDLDLSDEK